MKRVITTTVLLVVVGLGLSSCSSASPKIDVCKQVMKIIGRFSELELKSISNPTVLAIDGTKTITELRKLALDMPVGPQKDYVNTLATDYELLVKKDSGFEAVMAFAVDVRKLPIVCPK